jgi:hypothetical protein
MDLCNSVYDDVIDLPIETLAFTMRWHIGTHSMCCAMMSGRCVWINMYRMGTADVQRVAGRTVRVEITPRTPSTVLHIGNTVISNKINILSWDLVSK